MRRFFTIITLLTAVCMTLPAQRFAWDLDFRMIFDNREGDHDVTPAKTIIMTRLAPEVGFTFGQHSRLMGGAVWVQPIGNEWDSYHISPTLYYRYEGSNWKGSLGMFPRTQLHEELPGFMWGDSLSYHQANIRGGLLQYERDRSFVDIYLDWRQLQTMKKREAFNIVLHGHWQPTDVFFAGAHVMMNHYALTAASLPDEHIVDNFLVNPYFGVDLSRRTPLDSLSLRAGPVLTVERNRAHENWETPIGGWLEVNAAWHRWYLKNTLYAGGVQMPSYGEFGGSLYQGDPFYSRKFYDRLDVGFSILGTKWVRLDASLDFNFYKGGFIFYQKVTAEVTLP